MPDSPEGGGGGEQGSVKKKIESVLGFWFQMKDSNEKGPKSTEFASRVIASH